MLLPADGVKKVAELLSARIKASYLDGNVVELRVETSQGSGTLRVPLASFFQEEQQLTLVKTELAPSNKSLQRMSKRQEKETAEKLGGKRQPGSGAREGYKADVRVKGKWRIECKLTTRRSRNVSIEELRKIAGECSTLEKPAFVVRFVDPSTRQVAEEWAMVPMQEFLALADNNR